MHLHAVLEGANGDELEDAVLDVLHPVVLPVQRLPPRAGKCHARFTAIDRSSYSSHLSVVPPVQRLLPKQIDASRALLAQVDASSRAHCWLSFLHLQAEERARLARVAIRLIGGLGFVGLLGIRIIIVEL